MMNPVLRKRLINSIDYLRKMDFFQDYSNLSSGEILEEILGGKIGYPLSWWDEEKGHLHGGSIIRGIQREWRDWIKKSDFEIDHLLIQFDTKRVILEIAETNIDDEMGTAILKRLARISRGVFRPTNVSSRWLTPPDSDKWLIQEVGFDFKGRRHAIQIALRYDYLEDIGLEQLNEIIKDSEYQYYQVKHELITVVVLTEEEAEKLKKERGWKFEYII
ncbi:MAG: hypothetical protein QXU11_09990 [Thermoproteota archaeon]